MSKEDDFQSILENGISFGRGGGPHKEDDKVKTKAKKKKYITGAHGILLSDGQNRCRGHQ